MMNHTFRVILYSELWLTHIVVWYYQIYSKTKQIQSIWASKSTYNHWSKERILFSIDRRLKVNLNFQELETVWMRISNENSMSLWIEYPRWHTENKDMYLLDSFFCHLSILLWASDLTVSHLRASSHWPPSGCSLVLPCLICRWKSSRGVTGKEMTSTHSQCAREMGKFHYPELKVDKNLFTHSYPWPLLYPWVLNLIWRCISIEYLQ